MCISHIPLPVHPCIGSFILSFSSSFPQPTHSERIHLRGLSQVSPSNPSLWRGRENPLQLSSRERPNYSMDGCRKSRFDCCGAYFVSVVKLFQSSCSILVQPSALSMSEWFPPAHWDQNLPHEVWSLRHPPSCFLLCVSCYVILGRNGLGAGVDDFFRRPPMAPKMKSGIYDVLCIQRRRNYPDLLLITAVRPRHQHQMDKDLLKPFKSFLHPSLSSLWESNI